MRLRLSIASFYPMMNTSQAQHAGQTSQLALLVAGNFSIECKLNYVQVRKVCAYDFNGAMHLDIKLSKDDSVTACPSCNVHQRSVGEAASCTDTGPIHGDLMVIGARVFRMSAR